MEIITFILRKLECYTHSGIGSSLVPVDRLAGKQTGSLADKNVISFNFLKFSSGRILQHLACLNEDMVLFEL